MRAKDWRPEDLGSGDLLSLSHARWRPEGLRTAARGRENAEEAELISSG